MAFLDAGFETTNLGHHCSVSPSEGSGQTANCTGQNGTTSSDCLDPMRFRGFAFHTARWSATYAVHLPSARNTILCGGCWFRVGYYSRASQTPLRATRMPRQPPANPCLQEIMAGFHKNLPHPLAHLVASRHQVRVLVWFCTNPGQSDDGVLFGMLEGSFYPKTPSPRIPMCAYTYTCLYFMLADEIIISVLLWITETLRPKPRTTP